MHRWKPAPRSMVIIYFGGFVLLWSGIAARLARGPGFRGARQRAAVPRRASRTSFPASSRSRCTRRVVVLLAWKADRWLFAHGPVAVVLAGAPLIRAGREPRGSCPRSSISSRCSTSGSRRCTSRTGGCRRRAGLRRGRGRETPQRRHEILGRRREPAVRARKSSVALPPAGSASGSRASKPYFA